MEGQVDFSKYYTIRQAAEFCDVSPSAVRNWMLTGRLPHQKERNRVYIFEDDLRRIRDERAAEAEEQVAEASAS